MELKSRFERNEKLTCLPPVQSEIQELEQFVAKLTRKFRQLKCVNLSSHTPLLTGSVKNFPLYMHVFLDLFCEYVFQLLIFMLVDHLDAQAAKKQVLEDHKWLHKTELGFKTLSTNNDEVGMLKCIFIRKPDVLRSKAHTRTHHYASKRVIRM